MSSLAVVAVSSGGGRQPRPAAPVLGPVGQELAAGAAACEAGGPQALPSVRLLGPLRSGDRTDSESEFVSNTSDAPDMMLRSPMAAVHASCLLWSHPV